jgi:hypothetical protein
MIRDGLLTFTGTSNGATGGITSGPYTDLPTTGTQAASNILDIGDLNGIPLTAVNGGGARDLGVGDDPMLKLSIICSVAFNASSTLQLQLQGAPDAGANTAGSFTTMWTSPVIANAQLIAGAELANVDLPRVVPGQPLPRYLKLNFITAVGTNSTGTINAGIVIDRFDQIVGTTGQLSGYPAGITVAN